MVNGLPTSAIKSKQNQISFRLINKISIMIEILSIVTGFSPPYVCHVVHLLIFIPRLSQCTFLYVSKCIAGEIYGRGDGANAPPRKVGRNFKS